MSVFQTIYRFMIAAVGAGLCGGVAGAAEGRHVGVWTLEADRLGGHLRAFDLRTGLSLQANDRTIHLRPDEVVRIQTDARGLPRDGSAPLWSLDQGDRVYGHVVAGSDRTVTLRNDELGTLELDLSRLREAAFSAARTVGAIKDPTATAARASGDDEVLLANGDRITGLIERIDPNGLRIETDSEHTQIGMGVVSRVRFAHVKRAAEQTGTETGLRARLMLADGSILTVSGIRWHEGKFLLRFGDGISETRAVPISLPRPGRNQNAEMTDGERSLADDRVLLIEVLGGRWRWLTDMTPSHSEHVPLLDVHWPHRVDSNVKGEPMRVGGLDYTRGLGVHSRSRLVYELDPTCERFVSHYGIDDDSGPQAHVEVKVLVDGKVVYSDSDVRCSGRLSKVTADLRGGKRLELFVDFGKNGDLLDRFNWIDPGIIRR